MEKTTTNFLIKLRNKEDNLNYYNNNNNNNIVEKKFKIYHFTGEVKNNHKNNQNDNLNNNLINSYKKMCFSKIKKKYEKSID